ncbi:MAG: S41 family peptidase [Candidatus Parcubacteria bacterium]|nr:S41 family peptidase [Candidatus Parcubacteria bacterium]
MTRKTKIIFSLSALLTVGASVFLGIFIGLHLRTSAEKVAEISNKDPKNLVLADFSTFWQAWDVLNEKYIYSASTTNQQKVYGAIQGLAASYNDPYTFFMPPSEASVFAGDIAGSFEGVGMEIGTRQKVLTVVSPLKGSPAKKAGVLSGDKILKIDDKVSVEMSPEEAVKLIRGKGGSTVKLTLLREDSKEPIVISVVRGNIEVPTIETEARPDGIFVIRLFSFTETSPTLFRNALREFVAFADNNPDHNKLLLDLRGNPGGYLDAAVDMASWFLPAGSLVVKEDYGDKGPGLSHRSRGYDIFTDNLRFVILVDGGSASASEIFAGALSEHGKAKLVGSKTFGKGCVQELVPLPGNTFLKVTVAEWLTPKGNSISDNGIMPQYEVKVTQEDINNKKDRQLEKAISVLNNWK